MKEIVDIECFGDFLIVTEVEVIRRKRKKKRPQKRKKISRARK